MKRGTMLKTHSILSILLLVSASAMTIVCIQFKVETDRVGNVNRLLRANSRDDQARAAMPSNLTIEDCSI
jgi:hypothetical protein